MIFEEPKVEFVALNPVDNVTTSGGMAGTDDCKGNTSKLRNCEDPMQMDQCGIYYSNDTDLSASTP